MFRFIHTSDWQLGKPFGRFPDPVRAALQEARLDAIDSIGRIAGERAVVHVLVAGDVFDNSDPGDRLLVQALSRMSRHLVTWWLLPGNHDYVRADGLWSRVRAKAPPNVRVLVEPEAVALEDGAWVLAAPLEYRRTREDATAHYDRMQTPPGALRIGLAHGSIADFAGQGEATNLIPADRARTAGLDYLALGDWHGHLLVNERTAYSGTPEVDRFGRDDPGSVLLISLAPAELPVIERIETGRFRWLSREWTINSITDYLDALGQLRTSTPPAQMLVQLSIIGLAALSDRVAILHELQENLAHELRWLEVSASNLAIQPSADDLANIDVQGTLAIAAARLQARIKEGGAEAALASAALERLYVETLRLVEGQR